MSDYWSDFWALRRLSRRTAIRNAGLLSAAGFLAACSPSAPQQAGSNTSPSGSTTPKRGGTLRVTFGIEPVHFDTHQLASLNTMYLTANCYNQLLRPDPNDETKLIGDLAETWQFSQDGTAITFNLRKNVTFHDGKPFTARDVEYTLNRFLNPPRGVVPARRTIASNMAGIDVVNDHTLTVRLKRPQPDIIWSYADGFLHIFPRHVLEPLDASGEGMKKTIVGTGPFKLARAVEGEVYELTRNDNYFLEGKPYLDGIQIYPIKELALQSAALETGKIDFIEYLEDVSELDRLKKVNGVTVVEKPRTFLVNIIVRMNPPWDNIKAREALSLAIDRTQFIQTMGDIGFIKFHSMGLMPPGSIYSLTPEQVKSVSGYDTTPGLGGDIRANRARARQLLREAGIPEGAKVAVTSRNDLASFRDSAVTVATQLREIGLDATANTIEQGRYSQQVIAQSDFELVVHSVAATNTTLDGVFGEVYTSYGGRNYGKWTDPAIDQAFEALSGQTDEAKRMEMAKAFQLQFMKTFYHINIGWRGSGLVMRNNLKGWQSHTVHTSNMNLDGMWMDR